MPTFKIKNPVHCIIGIFLLIWATNAYFIFGNSLKYFSLLLGFLLIVWSGIRVYKSSRFYVFFGISTSLYIIYLLLALWNSHNTLEPLNMAFSLICYILLLMGYLYGSVDIPRFNINNRYKLLFSVLVIIGSLAFYVKQTTYIGSSSEGMRNLGDETLNPVGIAYTHSLLIVFQFWILQQTRNRYVQLITFLSIFSAFIVVVSTLSRGAIIFLIIFFLIYYFRGTKFNSRVLLNGLKALIGLALLFGALIFLAQENQFIQLKFEALSNRFISLFGYTTNNVSDLSAIAREDVYDYFFNNIDLFYLGQLNYIAYPHNQFLEIIMRWGFFGIPLLIFSIWTFLKGLIFFKKQLMFINPLFFLILSLFLFSYFQSMTSMSLEMNRMLWLGFGFITGAVRKPARL